MTPPNTLVLLTWDLGNFHFQSLNFFFKLRCPYLWNLQFLRYLLPVSTLVHLQVIFSYSITQVSFMVIKMVEFDSVF